MNGTDRFGSAAPSSWTRSLFIACTAAVLAATAACGHGVERDAHAGPGAAAPEVTVAEPVVLRVGELSEHTGRSQAVESVEIRARASGQLQRVAFHEGELVKKGDLLFVVDPRPYDAALTRAKAELERARVDQQLGTRETGRAEQLFKSNTISERDWDTQSSSLLQLGARLQVAAAAVSSAQLDVDYAYVRAPISGRIGQILVTQGNLVGPTLVSPLTTLVSVDPIYVYVDVDEKHAMHLGRVSAATPIVAKVGFADEADYPHAATLDFVDNRVDPETGTLRVRVVVSNPDGKLTPGLFARVRLPDGVEHDSVLVADRAIGTDQDRRYVLVIDGEDTARYRAVKLGPLHQGLRVVREGLTASDRVVVRGLQRVRPGAKVKAQQIAMSKDIDATSASADADGGAR
jgi:RND family efflux transporter MFP subunit